MGNLANGTFPVLPVFQGCDTSSDQTLIRGPLISLEAYRYFLRHKKCRPSSTIEVHVQSPGTCPSRGDPWSGGLKSIYPSRCTKFPYAGFSRYSFAERRGAGSAPAPSLYGCLSISTRRNRKAS